MSQGLKKKFQKSLRSVNKRLKTINKRVLAVPLFLLLILVLSFLRRDLFVVSLVNGQPITRLSLIRELEKQSGKEVLETLITQTLIKQEATKKGIVVSNDEIDGRIKALEAEVVSRGGNLDELLASRGQTKADLKRQAEVQILIETLLKESIQATDQETKEYFEKNRDTYDKGTTFEEAKAEIEGQLRDQKLLQAFQSWMEGLRNEAKIVYFKNY